LESCSNCCVRLRHCRLRRFAFLHGCYKRQNPLRKACNLSRNGITRTRYPKRVRCCFVLRPEVDSPGNKLAILLQAGRDESGRNAAEGKGKSKISQNLRSKPNARHGGKCHFPILCKLLG
jgi:hypothetical protein